MFSAFSPSRGLLRDCEIFADLRFKLYWEHHLGYRVAAAAEWLRWLRKLKIVSILL